MAASSSTANHFVLFIAVFLIIIVAMALIDRLFDVPPPRRDRPRSSDDLLDRVSTRAAFRHQVLVRSWPLLLYVVLSLVVAEPLVSSARASYQLLVHAACAAVAVASYFVYRLARSGRRS